MKRSLLILFFSAITFGVSAQDKEQKNSSFLMFVHGGYAYSPNKEGKGLTSSSADYAKKMSSGACWNLQLFYRYKKFVVGMMYSGFPVTQTGFSTVMLYASELPAGMYLYVLVVDNVIADSKRMILTK